MENEKIKMYNFMMRLLKERNISVGDFHVKCKVSRTTPWRIMHGHQVPTAVQQENIVAILELDELEKSEFFDHVNRLEFDENEIKAFKLIEEIFSATPKKATCENLEFIVHNGRKVVLDYEEVLDVIYAAAKQEDFFCDISIVSCTDDDVILPFESLLSKCPLVKINHYVRFYENDVLENVNVFKSILPLLRHNGYNAFARTVRGRREVQWVDDMIFIRLPDKYMVICFEKERYHNCHISDNATMHNFFLDKLSTIAPLYEVFAKEKNLDLIAVLCHEIENSNDFLIYKASPSYDLIQRHIWEALIPRGTAENYAVLFAATRNDDPQKAQMMISSFIDILDRRYKFNLNNNSSHLLTKKGLTHLMQTGRLTDHLPWLPSFTKDEVRDMLSNLLKRHLDPQDKLRVVITDSDTKMDMCIIATSSGELSVEYTNDKVGYVNNYFFKQDQLARTFMEFAELYAPKNLSLTDSEIEKFIKDLIK